MQEITTQALGATVTGVSQDLRGGALALNGKAVSDAQQTTTARISHTCVGYGQRSFFNAAALSSQPGTSADGRAHTGIIALDRHTILTWMYGRLICVGITICEGLYFEAVYS